MLEVLPLRILSDEDSPIFGSLNASLAKLARSNLPVASGLVIVAPEIHLKTVLEHFDFGHKEIFEQSLSLVKKEIQKTSIPAELLREVGKHSNFFLAGEKIKSVKALWLKLLDLWILEIKTRLWKDGFYQGLTEGLEPQVVIFIKNLKAFGSSYFDSLLDEVVINAKEGKLNPRDLRKIDDLVTLANKKLLITHKFEWVLDGEVKLSKILPFTPQNVFPSSAKSTDSASPAYHSTVKVFLDLSTGFTLEKGVDGVFIDSSKSFDLNKPQVSFNDMLWRLVESATTFDDAPVIFKLADKSEGMGKIRGALRLIHQKNLFDPLIEAITFARSKKNLTNVHILLPFVRTVSEVLQLKRDLAVKKIMRKANLQLWLEIAVPENIVNLSEYLAVGVDGVVLNIDELLSHLSGFDNDDQTVSFYKQDVRGLIKFLGDSLRILSKSKIPFIFYGSSCLNPEILELLVERGGYGIVVERYEISGIHELLHNTEKKVVLRKESCL